MPTQVRTAILKSPGGPRPPRTAPDSIFQADLPIFLLESAQPAAAGPADARPYPGRWTMAGGSPAAILTAKRSAKGFALALTTWRRPDGRSCRPAAERTWTGDPFAALRDLQAAYAGQAPSGGDLPPFCGGLVGYLGYETAHAIEDLPGRARDDLQLPDLAFMVADEIIAQDDITGQVHLIVTGRGPTCGDAGKDAESRLAGLQRDVASWAEGADPLEGERLSCPGRLEGSGARRAEEPGSRAGRSHGWRRPASLGRQPLSLQGVGALFPREDYCAAVRKCKEAILAGRVFEVCLTQRMEMDYSGSGWELYQVLRSINPAPFASYLRFEGFEVVSASPERFLRLDADGVAESRPIKGTRPRGETRAQDARLKEELASSAKDRAENVMIVDLVRSDLGRVCQAGSVTVPELCVSESYPTVHQLVSTVRGRLRPGLDALDLARACFPGGSMTGAPKIEAMKLIDEIEPVTRGVYSGAIGYLDRRGTMDLAIVIRTIVCRQGKAYFGVGGAVTADSDPASEYQETLDKARALITAVKRVQEG